MSTTTEKQKRTTSKAKGADEATVDEQIAAAESLDLEAIRAELADKGLWAKIAWVQHHVGQVEKTGQVSFGGTSFKHMQEHGLIGVLRPLMRVAGLGSIPGCMNAGAWHIDGNSFVVDLALTVFDVESGESVTRWYPNIGVDKADKGFNKAFTGATKYALQKFFEVPTEGIDDNETLDVERVSSGQARNVQAAAAGKADPARVEALKETIKQAGVPGQEVVNYLTATFGVSLMANLSAAQFNEFSVWVNNRITPVADAA